MSRFGINLHKLFERQNERFLLDKVYSFDMTESNNNTHHLIITSYRMNRLTFYISF